MFVRTHDFSHAHQQHSAGTCIGRDHELILAKLVAVSRVPRKMVATSALAMSVALLVSGVAAVAAAGVQSTDPQKQFVDAFGTGPVLVVANYRSNIIIDWTSPRSTMITAAGSEGVAAIDTYSEGIGHAAVFFRREAGAEVIGVGQTGEDHGQGVTLLEHGLGFTTITNAVFTDGSLQNFSFLDSKAFLAMDAADAKGRKGTKFAWIAFQLNETQATGVQSFLDAYVNSSAFQNYGFVVDPLKLQGGGCTSFANAMVTHAGVPFPLQTAWDRQVHIPADLMGFNQTTIDSTPFVRYMGPALPNRSVPLPTVLGRGAWADPGDKTATVFQFYDPELFYLTSSLSRNALLVQHGLNPVDIVDNVVDDAFAKALNASASQWVQQQFTQLSLRTLYGIQGVVVAANGTQR